MNANLAAASAATSAAAGASVARRVFPAARLAWLHLRSRRAPAALVALLACGVALWASLRYHWWPGTGSAADALPMILEGCAAAIITVAAHSPFGEPELVTGRRLPLLRAGLAIALCGAAIGFFALGAAAAYHPQAGVYLAGGILPVARDVLGMTGIGMIVCLVAGAQIAWIGPLAFTAICQFALVANYSEPLTWPARPPADLGGWVAAMVVFAVGLVAFTLRGPRVRPSGELRRPARRRAAQHRAGGRDRRLNGMTVVKIPGSKSITARALFLAAASRGTTVLRHPLRSDDSAGFVEGLGALGYQVTQEEHAWTIEGRPEGPSVTEAAVYCRDGATTARFLPALAATGHGVFRFDASEQMRRRPLGPLAQALRDLGVDLVHEDREGHHPITIRANGIAGGHVTLDAGLSSQFLTALLLLGPLTAKGLEVTVTDLVSVPYVEITLAMMERFGVRVQRDGSTFQVPSQPYEATDYQIEPDASTASYFLAAAALTGRSVTIPGLGSAALQGDLKFTEVLRQMGASVRLTGDSVTVTGDGGPLHGVTVNMRDISDTVPTLAAIAPFADGPVRIEDVYNTRIKECDRLEACAQNLTAMGVPVSTGRDWIEIRPAEPRPARVACHGDHRIAMSFSITGLKTAGITLDDPGCVKKTFPEFHDTLTALRNAWEGERPPGE